MLRPTGFFLLLIHLPPRSTLFPYTTLFRSLGFHKQMDNRIKLLEEILSFRMQGVEFDNGDMYVDGHKAASEKTESLPKIGRAVQQECRDRSRMPSSA